MTIQQRDYELYCHEIIIISLKTLKKLKKNNYNQLWNFTRENHHRAGNLEKSRKPRKNEKVYCIIDNVVS